MYAVGVREAAVLGEGPRIGDGSAGAGFSCLEPMVETGEPNAAHQPTTWYGAGGGLLLPEPSGAQLGLLLRRHGAGRDECPLRFGTLRSSAWDRHSGFPLGIVGRWTASNG